VDGVFRLERGFILPRLSRITLFDSLCNLICLYVNRKQRVGKAKKAVVLSMDNFTRGLPAGKKKKLTDTGFCLAFHSTGSIFKILLDGSQG
jgi:hypothetical protein